MERIADFRHLFDCHFTPLVKYSYLITKDKAQSKDIVQNFFVEIWKTGRIDSIQSFEAFAFISVRNKSLSYVRSRKKIELTIPEVPFHDQHTVNDGYFPAYLLESAIQRLPSKCQQVFVLNKLEGLTHNEIAVRLNVSVKTVEKHVGVGWRKLKEYLAPYKARFLEGSDV